MLGVRRRNMCAITPSHQHAILSLAQIRNAHGQPYSDRRQRDGKSERCDVCQHAMTKVVGLFPISLVARQIIRFLPGVRLPDLVAPLSRLTRRVNRGARPKFEHAVFVFRDNGPLGFHWCQFRDNLLLFSTLANRPTNNVDMAPMRYSIAPDILSPPDILSDELSLQRVVEPAVINF